jgi:hypothetical protein
VGRDPDRRGGAVAEVRAHGLAALRGDRVAEFRKIIDGLLAEPAPK